MNWEKVEASLPDGNFVVQVKVHGKKICLVREEGQYFALQNSCPHAGGIMSGGWCKHGNIVCPIHRYEYNLQTGRGAPGQGDYLDTYTVDIRSDGLYIGMKASWWKRIFS